jgi:hypothetical protein
MTRKTQCSDPGRNPDLTDVSCQELMTIDDGIPGQGRYTVWYSNLAG